MKMISDKKQERLLLKDRKDFEGFINQNLTDTRYIISQFVSMLNAFNKVKGYKTHIVCLKSSYTDLYRKVLGFNKNRNMGDQHHAYDAACLCIADKCLNTYYPYYDLRNSVNARIINSNNFDTYSEFVKELNGSRETNNDPNSKLRRFVVYAFKKTYKQDVYKMGKEAPLIEEIKSTTPLISWKVEKNYDGKLFDSTMRKPKDKNDKSVLTLIGVNNEKRSFDSTYTVAVDFYKIHHKHYAIHIPLAIVDKDGNINKDLYLKLIKEHYNAKDLINADGTLNTKPFKFRAYKNDLIFDTVVNECHLFNLGSIANKKIEIKQVDIHSYNSIYDCSETMRINLISRYNVKTRNNPDGVDFKTIDKQLILNYLCDEFNIIDNPKKHKERLFELTKDINNIYNYCDNIAYLSCLANDKYVAPIFDERIISTPNNDFVSKDPDCQYIKIKYNVLGVRFSLNDNGKLVVSGPAGYKNGGFKLIKKEEFHWTISKEMI